jgi:hypothetical protein
MFARWALLLQTSVHAWPAIHKAAKLLPCFKHEQQPSFITTSLGPRYTILTPFSGLRAPNLPTALPANRSTHLLPMGSLLTDSRSRLRRRGCGLWFGSCAKLRVMMSRRKPSIDARRCRPRCGEGEGEARRRCEEEGRWGGARDEAWEAAVR